MYECCSLSAQMETTDSISVQTFINNLTEYLTGSVSKQTSIIKLNSENLSIKGELHFLHSLKAWTCLLKHGNECNEKCATILHHSLHMRGVDLNGKSDDEVVKEAFEILVSTSDHWHIKIAQCSLEKERVCLYLNRLMLLTNAIKLAVQAGNDFGKNSLSDKAFYFKYYEDKESELTSTRLYHIKRVTEKILTIQGYRISDEESTNKYEFTTKSEGKVEESFKKYICGVVKNSKTNSKETKLSWEDHVLNKINELRELNEQKLFDTKENETHDEEFLNNIAKATAIFELLTVKPSRPVFIGHGVSADRSVTNNKGAPFILYNTARIASIIAKYNEKQLSGEYPKLQSIDETDFSYLKQEEEWELIFNFIVGYPQTIRDSLNYEFELQINPQVICLFLSRLCQKFSVYYRKVKILTEGYDHLIPVLTARLYMLHALQIVLKNTLEIFGINPVSHM